MPRTTHPTAELKRLTINFPADQVERVSASAAAAGVTTTEYLRTAAAVLLHLGEMGVTNTATLILDGKERDMLLPFNLNPAVSEVPSDQS